MGYSRDPCQNLLCSIILGKEQTLTEKIFFFNINFFEKIFLNKACNSGGVVSLGLRVCMFCMRVGNVSLGLALWMPTGDFRNTLHTTHRQFVESCF